MTMLKLVFLFLSILMICCHTKEKANRKYIPIGVKLPDLPSPSMLTKFDSSIINKSFEAVTKIDTIVAKNACSIQINYFDAFNNVRVQAFQQNCISDTRLVWGVKMFFGKNKDTLLVYTFDGVGNAVQVRH